MNIVTIPIADDIINTLKVGDVIYLSGYIYTGRDAVLPQIVNLIEDNKLESEQIELRGSVIFHTAVSQAGVGPTSSNKVEIEGSFKKLSEAGVKIHLGKGSISKDTGEFLKQYNSLYAITPPVTALLESKIVEKKVIAYSELGMEAFYQLKVSDFPAIIAVAHGESIYKY